MKEIDFLRFMIENIVEHTDDISIDSQDDEMWTLLTLIVHPDDMWIVIWKKGSTVNALRSVIRLHGMKHWKKVTLKVNELSDSF